MINGHLTLKCIYDWLYSSSGGKMELGVGEIYLFDYQSYNQLHMALEIAVEKNINFSCSLISRMPPRRLLENLDISSINVQWMTETNHSHSAKPELLIIDEAIKNFKHKSKDNLIIFEGLEMLKDIYGEGELISHIYQLSDIIANHKTTIILCLNSLAFSQQSVAKLKLISKPFILQDREEDLTAQYVSEGAIDTPLPGDKIELEMGGDGNPRLVLLAKLPRIGFTKNILVKRILQWRRMGLDVSEIEPALSYSDDKAYELYKIVEEKVRVAVDLDRFIHQNIDSIPAADVATDIFRLRQLTGLDDLEKKYYSSPD